MNNEQLKFELARCGIGWIECDDRIIALEPYICGTVAGCMQVDVTGFSKIEIKIWIKRSKK